MRNVRAGEKSISSCCTKTALKLVAHEEKFLTPVVIVFVLIVAAMLTWFLPEDSMRRNISKGRLRLDVGIHRFYNGVCPSGRDYCIHFMRGAAWVINQTRAIDSGIRSFLEHAARLERFPLLRRLGVNNLVIVSVMLLFSLFGAVFGMSEETIAFTALIIPLALSMGYDSITGVCMVYVAAHVGFAGAFMNPFTVGIAQDLSGLPFFPDGLPPGLLGSADHRNNCLCAAVCA